LVSIHDLVVFEIKSQQGPSNLQLVLHTDPTEGQILDLEGPLSHSSPQELNGILSPQVPGGATQVQSQVLVVKVPKGFISHARLLHLYLVCGHELFG
jgi:hypothetical protein